MVNPDLLLHVFKLKIYLRLSQGCLTNKPLSVPTNKSDQTQKNLNMTNSFIQVTFQDPAP